MGCTSNVDKGVAQILQARGLCSLSANLVAGLRFGSEI